MKFVGDPKMKNELIGSSSKCLEYAVKIIEFADSNVKTFGTCRDGTKMGLNEFLGS